MEAKTYDREVAKVAIVSLTLNKESESYSVNSHAFPKAWRGRICLCIEVRDIARQALAVSHQILKKCAQRPLGFNQTGAILSRTLH